METLMNSESVLTRVKVDGLENTALLEVPTDLFAYISHTTCLKMIPLLSRSLCEHIFVILRDIN